MGLSTRILQSLKELYGADAAQPIFERIGRLVAEHLPGVAPAEASAAEAEPVFLIVYPDQIHEPAVHPLVTLRSFFDRYLTGVIGGMHLLPFFPSTSDDGFAVVDYKTVEPRLGTWADVADLSTRSELMFDAVVNHVSASSLWFRAFLDGIAPYDGFFIRSEPEMDISHVVRPRTSPLFTTFSGSSGRKSVWTTFSSDQADLDFRNPQAMLAVLDVLLFYISRGAHFLRLDAIAYAWKEAGTACVHLPQVHVLVRLIRAVLEAANPRIQILTETNVPHEENIAYLGDGRNEAHLVYNFGLPPMILHAFHTQQSDTLADFLEQSSLPAGRGSYFNILATHDGIGVNGAQGFLKDSELNQLALRIERAGGFVSMRAKTGGEAPYELNVNYLDALDAVSPPGNEELSLRRFITAHAIMLALRGVPGLYFHSLFGSRGWPEGVRRSGKKRTINRQKLRLSEIEADLANPTSSRSVVFSALRSLILARRSRAAFGVGAVQQVLRGSPGVVAISRLEPSGDPGVLCLHNITPGPQRFEGAALAAGTAGLLSLTDLTSGEVLGLTSDEAILLGPYESRWLARSPIERPAYA